MKSNIYKVLMNGGEKSLITIANELYSAVEDMEYLARENLEEVEDTDFTESDYEAAENRHEYWQDMLELAEAFMNDTEDHPYAKRYL